MREAIKRFVEMFSKSFPIKEPIYEFGSLQVPGQEGFADLRPLFKGKKFVGTALVIDTLEHTEDVRKAVNECYRVLKDNGILVITSVMNFPIHDYPEDYWRFTPEAFKSLLKPFKNSFVSSAGDKDFPHTIVGIGFKGDIDNNFLKEFEDKVNEWKEFSQTYW